MPYNTTASTNGYVVQLPNDTDIEMQPPFSRPCQHSFGFDEDVAHEELYRRHLQVRPLPPTPAATPPRTRRPIPMLITAISDPFVDRVIERDVISVDTFEAGETVRMVPKSSGMCCSLLFCVTSC